jgi:hypothetical protein
MNSTAKPPHHYYPRVRENYTCMRTTTYTIYIEVGINITFMSGRHDSKDLSPLQVAMAVTIIQDLPPSGDLHTSFLYPPPRPPMSNIESSERVTEECE